MQIAVEQALSALSGSVACVVLHYTSSGPRTLVSLNPDRPFPAASVAKVPILVEVARQAAFPLTQKTGESAASALTSPFTWETRFAVPDSARVPSDGVLADLSPDLRPTLHDLAHLMITISDNTASNLLLDLVGMDTVNAEMRRLGLAHTRLERRFIDFAARKAGRDNWTCAADMAHLFSLLCSATLPGHEIMLKMLLRQNEYSLLSAYWDEEIPFAHKPGALPGLLHDAGILFLPHKDPLILVALTSDQPDVPLTQLTLARVGRIIYNNWLSMAD